MATSEDHQQFAKILLAKREQLRQSIQDLKNDGASNTEIAHALNVTESTVRDMLSFK
jgi:DNA-binding NarL/FixJ family response regulator